MTRYARQYVLMHPEDLIAPHGLDLTPGSRDTQKVERLTEMFARDGFDKTKAALIGYPSGDGRIQLASGTHRLEAAKRAGIRLPVHITLRSVVEAIWGTDQWIDFLKDKSVEQLEWAPVKEGGEAPALADRVDLSRDMEPVQ